MPLPKIACDLFLLFFEHPQPQVTSNFLLACFAHRPTPNGPLVPQEWQATSQPLHRHGLSQKESTLLWETNTPMPRKIPKYPRIQINDTAAWQLVQLQLAPLAQKQAEVHPVRKEEINKSLQRIPDSNTTVQLGPVSTRMPLPKIACDLFLLFFGHPQPQVTSNFLLACFAHRPTPNGPLVPQEWQATSQPIHRHGFSQKESTLLYIAQVITDLIPSSYRAKETNTPMPRKIPKYLRIQIITVQLGSWCSCSWCRWHRSKRRSTLHARRKSTSPCKESLTATPQFKLGVSMPLDFACGLNMYFLRSYQPLQTYCLHVLPTGPPQMVLWCRRSGRQRPSLYTGMGSAKRNQHCSTLLYIAHVIADLIPVIQRQRRQTPQCPGKSQKYPRIQINDTAAWQLVQLQLVPLAREQAGVHPARKEKINKSLQRIPDSAATTQTMR